MRALTAASAAMSLMSLLQVGVFRRGKYAGGKKVGKGNVANVGDTVKKGQTLGYVEQLGTFVDVKVGGRWCVLWRGVTKLPAELRQSRCCVGGLGLCATLQLSATCPVHGYAAASVCAVLRCAMLCVWAPGPSVKLTLGPGGGPAPDSCTCAHPILC